MASRVNVVVSRTEPVGRWDQHVPDAYSRGAFHEICAADTTGAWGSFWRARARMALDEFDAMPQLEAAFSALRAEAPWPAVTSSHGPRSSPSIAAR